MTGQSTAAVELESKWCRAVLELRLEALFSHGFYNCWVFKAETPKTDWPVKHQKMCWGHLLSKGSIFSTSVSICGFNKLGNLFRITLVFVFCFFFFPLTSDHIFISAACVNWPFCSEVWLLCNNHLRRWLAGFSPWHLFWFKWHHMLQSIDPLHLTPVFFISLLLPKRDTVLQKCFHNTQQSEESLYLMSFLYSY